MVTRIKLRIFFKGFLIWSVKLAKNLDLDRYIYSAYGIGFDLRSEFSLPDGRVGKNGIIFEVYMISSVHSDNKKKYLLVLSIGKY